LLSNEFSLSEYTKIDVGWGFAPELAGRAYSAPQDPPAGFAARGKWRGGEWREGLGEEEEGKGGEKRE